MMKFVVSILILAVHFECGHGGAVLKLDSGAGGCDRPRNCNCIETILVEMPKDAKTCSQPHFVDGLSKKLAANYQLIQEELGRGDCDCNFNNVNSALQKISGQIKKIIRVLSDCHPSEDMLNDAIERYDHLKKEYNSAIRAATANQASKCGSILAKIRPVLLNCAENIMAAILKCLHLRRS